MGFSETGLPINRVLGNSGHEKSRSPEGPRFLLELLPANYFFGFGPAVVNRQV